MKNGIVSIKENFGWEISLHLEFKVLVALRYVSWKFFIMVSNCKMYICNIKTYSSCDSGIFQRQWQKISQ